MSWSKHVLSVLACLAAFAQGCDDSRLGDLSRIPASVTITVNPPRAGFHVDDEVVLGYVVLDANGIVIDGLAASWQVPPSDQVFESLTERGLYRFLRPGSHTWTVSLVDYPALTASVTLAAESVPASLEITVDPEREFYGIGDEVVLGYHVYAGDGQEIAGIGATWQAPVAADVLSLGADRYRFLREGAFVWTVTLEPPWGLTGSVTLRVDAQGPELFIEVPERGDTLVKDTPQAEVSVRGRVSDGSSGLASLTLRTNALAATEVAVDPNGSFAALAPAEPGLNVVVLEAIDLAGNATSANRAFLYAPAYFDPRAAPGDELLTGFEDALLTDRALDRGQPPAYDPCGHDASDRYRCSAVEDVASLLELVLNNLDFTSLQDERLFHFPLLDERWLLDLAGFAQVSFQLEAFFDLRFAFSEVAVGEAKVLELSSYGAGIQADLGFDSWTDSGGLAHPGLSADLGMTGTLQVLGQLDLTTSDPIMQNFLCLLALNLCNPNPPFDCLYEYLASCTPVPTPVASITSVIDTPMLAGLDVESMSMQADLVAGLDPATGQPNVDLARMQLSLGQGALDVSALENLTIQLGTIRFASYQIDLGTFVLDTSFIADLADQLLDPLLDALLPLIEPVLGMVFTCSDPDNPVCIVIPFFEQLLAAFSVNGPLQVPNPFAPPGAPALVEAQLRTAFDEIEFRTGFGGRLALSGRVDAEPAAQVDAHRDDDLLGVPLLGGCLLPDPGFAGTPTGGRGIQLALSIDAINQVLFAAWISAGLDLDLQGQAFPIDPALDVTGLQAEIRPWLPPVIDHCPEPESRVAAQWGDVHLTLSFSQTGEAIAVEAFASLSVPGELVTGADGQPGLALSPPADWFKIEFVSLTADGQPVDARSPQAVMVGQLVRTALLGFLLEQLIDAGLAPLQGLSPTFDISAWPGIDPAQAHLGVGDFAARTTQGRLVLNGDLGQ